MLVTSLVLLQLTGLHVLANRSDRRRLRIQSLLENHVASTATPLSYYSSYYRWSSGTAQPLPPIFNTWMRWGPQSETPTTAATTTTPHPLPTLSPYDQWYYRDDQNYTQGPFSSSTMLEWHRAGYFRPSLLLRRDIDNVYTPLSHYTRLYGRVPFAPGAYPRAILVYTTTTTTTPATTTTTTTTSTTTTRTTVSTAPLIFAPTSSMARPTWRAALAAAAGPEERGGPQRGDVVAIEDPDYHNDDNSEDKSKEDGCGGDEECRPSLPDGTLRLSGGRDETEGNVEVYHMGVWGSVCDDEWDKDEAAIVCKYLGFPGVIAPTHGSRYGYGLSTIWMDNLYCYGTEKNIVDCRFDGWGINDCDRTESAGVRCKPKPPPTTTTTTTTARPKFPMTWVAKELEVRLAGGRTEEEGRLEVRFDRGAWGTVCGDGWGVREAMVACRQLGLKYAAGAFSTNLFGGQNLTKMVSGISCKGNEDSLMECQHDQFGDVFCPGDGSEIGAVACTETQADLEPDLYQLMSSTHLEDKQLFLLQCAMEENCLASGAYYEQKTNPSWQMLTRRLLRFTTSIANIGSADFRPFIPKSAWDWHACHQHYHSMETFAHFEIYDLLGNRAAEGHKASFCLEDNDCSGVDPHYDCENYGDQGITPGCKDIYYYNIDCQWIDVTDLPLGTYLFRMAINPEYKVPETTFENNAAMCTLYYSQMSATINNCTLTRP